VKDKANADGGFLEAEVRGSTWLALVRRRIFAAEKSEKMRDCPHTVLGVPAKSRRFFDRPVNRRILSVDPRPVTANARD
jgi:hypothetical protein